MAETPAARRPLSLDLAVFVLGVAAGACGGVAGMAWHARHVVTSAIRAEREAAAAQRRAHELVAQQDELVQRCDCVLRLVAPPPDSDFWKVRRRHAHRLPFRPDDCGAQ